MVDLIKTCIVNLYKDFMFTHMHTNTKHHHGNTQNNQEKIGLVLFCFQNCKHYSILLYNYFKCKVRSITVKKYTVKQLPVCSIFTVFYG